MAKVIENVTQNAISYVVTLLIGGLIMMLMQSGAKEARLAVLEKRETELTQEVREIKKTMAEGGPAALAQRVDALYRVVETQNAKLDRVIELLARR